MVLFLIGSARGQGFDAQRYTPPSGSAGGLLIERASIPDRSLGSVGLSLSIADDPVVLSDPNTGEILARPVDSLASLDLLGSIIAAERFEMALDIPVLLLSEGDPFSLGGQTLAAAPGLGDLRLVPKLRISGDYRSKAIVSFALPVTLPSGDENAMRGAGEASFEPRLLLGLRSDPLRIHTSAGLRARPGLETLDPIGSELTFGAGLVWVVRQPIDLMIEAAGALDLTRPGRALTDLPLEILGGMAVRPVRGLSITAGAGPGLTDGLGTPTLRGLIGVRYVFERGAPASTSGTDADRDGVPDDEDDCAMTPEDSDGYLDKDGCPEPDNDEDGVLDDADECPQSAEEPGGDGDGCPASGHARVVSDEDGEDQVEVDGKILFATNSAEIDPRSDTMLDEIARLLDEREIQRLEIRGHTDSTGDEDYNEELSLQRADSVRRALIERGIDAGRLRTRGYGERRPIAPNDTPAGRAQNRRVELVVRG